MTSTIAILGASGLVGRTIIGELAGTGDWQLILVGRDAQRLTAAAAAVTDPVPPITLAIGEDTDWPTILNRIPRPDLVLNLVGPSTDTAPPVLQWCLDHGVHYCDLANELDAVHSTLAAHGVAQQAAISVVTGAGFGMVATEALVLALRGDRPPARTARVAAMPGMAAKGRNVAASAVEVLAAGGRAYRGGTLTTIRLGSAHWRVPTPDGKDLAGLGIAVGDLESTRRAAGADEVDAYSTEIPVNAVVRAVLPVVVRAARRPIVRRVLESAVARTHSPGPVAGQDRAYVSLSYAQLDWANGESRAGWLQMGDGYEFSAKVAAAVVRAQLAGEITPGATTPAAALGDKLAFDAGATLVIRESS